MEVDPQFMRPGEVPHLLGDSSKIAKELGWTSETSLDDLIEEMLDYDTHLTEIEHLASSLYRPKL